MNMGHALSTDEVARFERDGFLSPIRAFSEVDAGGFRAALEKVEERFTDGKATGMRTDLHLLQRWAWDVVTAPSVVEPVKSILGPNVLLWSLNWFIKEPQDGKIVTLHQDANYWGLEPHDVITAWVALSDASEATGPMRFLPGSHRGELHDHENTFAADNLLSRGQRINAELDESKTVLAPLSTGEMSLHHVRSVHGSGRNETNDRRIGMVLRYCATHVRQTKAPDTAVLVAGQDDYGHFDLLPPPATDFGPEESARHADAVKRLNAIIHDD